jgi:hypothetical protein
MAPPTNLLVSAPKRPGNNWHASGQTSHKTTYARCNLSTVALWRWPFTPFAQGSFKEAYLGFYQNGPRMGQKCVSKKFTIQDQPYKQLDAELRIIQLAWEIVKAWNAAGVIQLPIVLNIPEVWIAWTVSSSGTMLFLPEQRLVEPFINNFYKFNKNSGSVYHEGTFWSDALQALSHFSYHWTGDMVLCDIQGGVYHDKL